MGSRRPQKATGNKAKAVSFRNLPFPTSHMQNIWERENKNENDGAYQKNIKNKKNIPTHKEKCGVEEEE
jgi:hypothetical protein